jgi:hypothetical protein
MNSLCKISGGRELVSCQSTQRELLSSRVDCTVGRASSGTRRAIVTRVGSARVGATLSEVLVSLLIASIGLVSVATFFPLAVLRSIEATKRTQATVLKKNAEEFLDRSRWQGPPDVSVVWPPADQRRVLDDVRINLGVDGLPGRGGVDDDNDDDIDERNEVGFPGSDDRFIAVLDPLGVVTLGTEVFPVGATGAAAIPRLHGLNRLNYTPAPVVLPLDNVELRKLAAAAVSSRDTWTLVHSSDAVSGSTRTSCIMPGAGSLGMSFTATSPAVRIVMTDVTGRLSQTRTVINITGADVVSWGLTPTTPNAPLTPTGFVPTSAVIETIDLRYTWMALLRRTTVGVEADCIVFHKRSFQADTALGTANEELVHTATQLGAIDNRQVQFTAKPEFAKRGGYCISTNDLRAYRIQNMSDDGLVMTLIRADGNELANIPFDATTNLFSGVFLQGIVDVFPLGER